MPPDPQNRSKSSNYFQILENNVDKPTSTTLKPSITKKTEEKRVKNSDFSFFSTDLRLKTFS